MSTTPRLQGAAALSAPAQGNCDMRYDTGLHMHVLGIFKRISIDRLINVTGAGYADCDGLYSISNMSSIWDNKRIVYERVAGGWRPMDKR